MVLDPSPSLAPSRGLNQPNRVRSLVSRVDPAVAWIYLTNVWSLVKSPVGLVFIVGFLSMQEQGLWYTFSNLAALTIFADLGFTLIVTQFISHEYARLTLVDGRLVGEPADVDRLVSLARYAVRFYSVVIVIAVVVLSGVGFLYFRDQGAAVIAAWVGFSIAGGANLFLNFLQGVYRGLDRVMVTQRVGLAGSVAATLATWAALSLGAGIWALALGASVGVITLLYGLLREAPAFWWQLYTHELRSTLGWAREIVWLQGKYALTFACGYFVFNLLVPGVFKSGGPVQAGQLGLTLALVAVMQNFAIAGVNARIPKMNMLLASRRWRECSELVKRLTVSGAAIYAVGAVALVAGVWMLDHVTSYRSRLLDAPELWLIVAYQLAPTMTSAPSAFLRAQKDEPHLPLAVVQAVVIGAAIFTVLPRFGLFWMLVVIGVTFWTSVPVIFWMMRRSLRRFDRSA